jgi:hypothetical protein
VPPAWLTVIAWISLGIAFVTCGVILFDIFGRGHRQQMIVMDAVYPITALYSSVLALLLYWRWGRNVANRKAVRTRDRPALRQAVPEPATVPAPPGLPEPRGGIVDQEAAQSEGRPDAPSPVAPPRPTWVTLAIEVSHCGSGCTLGDVIGEWAVYALALTVADRALFAEYIGDYLLALAFGIVFQYFAIAPMRGLGLRDGLKAAAKADFIALTFFEVGLFGWMALMTYVFFPAPHHLMPNSAAFWFLMQIGMIVGFITSWPANVWLLRRGIKVAM